LLDKDGDGNISNYEIRSLMNSLGYSPSEEDISAVISKVDTNGRLVCKMKFYSLIEIGNGSVDFDEFLTMMKRRRSTGESDTELRQVFQVN
jgi:calmodulin